MATETLRPNAAGSENVISFQFPTDAFPATDHWNKVDEAVADEATTYIACAYAADNNIWKRDLYALPDSGVGAGTINSVKVYFRCIQSTNERAKASIRTHTTTYDGNEESLTDAWVTYDHTWANNPNTTDPWTWAEIDALEAGVNLKRIAATPLCTQVYVEVDYTPAAVDYPRTASVSLGLAPTVSRLANLTRIAAPPMGLAVSASRVLVSTRSSSVSLGLVPTASRLVNFPRTAANALGLAVIASRAIVISRTSSATMGLATTASRALALGRTAGISLGLAPTVSRAIAVARSAATQLGLSPTASRLLALARSSSVTLGLYTLAWPYTKIKRLVQTIGTNRLRGDVGTNREVSTTGENREVEDW